MLKYIIIVILLFFTVLIIRTLKFKPLEEDRVELFQVDLNERKIIDTFIEMIQLKTVSYKDTSLEDEEEFIRFRNLLIDKYPNINANCKLHNLGRTGVLYHWKGKSKDKPVIFMAHYDVVPANEDQWDKEPFSAIIEEGVLWGRGTLDTKSTLCGIMEAAEFLIEDGFIPENDIYLSFAGDEETNGESAKEIVSFLENQAVVPFMVLDEGGAIVQGAFPGVQEKMALIGTGEKGKMHIKLSLKGEGGHGSTPPPTSQIGRLAKAVNKIEKSPFQFHLSQPVKDLFNVAGRHSSFGLKIVFANLGLFSPILNLLTKKTGGELNALVRSTLAFTKMSGSDTINVIPPLASIEGDVRIMEGDTEESIIRGIKERIKDEDIIVESLDTIPVKPFSNIDTKAWDVLNKAIKSIWPEVIISPYLMLACSDSRSYTKISENVYRFSPMELTSSERKMIHGNNERIPVDKLITATKFYISLMKKL
ncbi:MAG TPA: M20/M25/M40 family metallo-hydrolase [Tissierellaceae bacterium]|nr:M20/M25/M40 family metallo-hydrolase [Tissierellaceae bacterium]